MTSVTATPATAAALGLEELAVRHQRGLWRYLRVLGARADVADDLLQEALLVAFENVWARKVVSALEAADAVLIDSIRIPAEVVKAALPAQ